MIYSPEIASKSFITSNNSDILEQHSKITLIKLSFVFFKSLKSRSAFKGTRSNVFFISQLGLP